MVGGTANLARFGEDFDSGDQAGARGARGARRAARLLGEATPDAVTVRIGHEGPYQGLPTTSVVATGYGPRRARPLGPLGILGPDPDGLPGSMAAVRAVARYVSSILDRD